MTTDHQADIQHVAIIMDGNGRWAKQRGLPRNVGHERGVEALRRTVEACRDTGLSYLTVFSFSSENWKRPAAEISALFGLLRIYVRQDLKRLKEDGVRVRVMGNRSGLPDDVLSLLEFAEAETRENTRFNLNIAFNYGARDEITQACREVAKQVEAGELKADDVTSEHVSSALWFADIPDPELLIRTSAEYRLSNFLLWQLAYTELGFVDCLWPDFGEEQLLNALNVYRQRERRFGGLSTQEASS